MRLCIIGDSHCAALKKGWERMLRRPDSVWVLADGLTLQRAPPQPSDSTPTHPTISIDWFASPGKTMNGLAVEAGDLVPNTPNLLKFLRLSTGDDSPRIRAGEYSHYLVYGLQFAPFHVPRLASQRVDSERVDGKFVTDLVAVLMETIAAVTVRKLKRVSTRPIHLCAAPFATSEGDHRASRFQSLWWSAASQAAERLGVSYLHQPVETLSGPFSTKSEFARSPSYPELDGVDGQHMNAEFGEIVMRAVLAALSQGLQSCTR